MTALLIISIILASITAYLGTGTALARRDLPRSIAANTHPALEFTGRYRYPNLQQEPVYRRTGPPEVNRAAVREEAALMTWCWPICAPARAWRHGLESRIDRYDPAVTRALEADLERLQTKINELKE